jgi:hypothetical protein
MLALMENTTTTYPAIAVFWAGAHRKADKSVYTDADVRAIFEATRANPSAHIPFVVDHRTNDLPVIGIAPKTNITLVRNTGKNRLEIHAQPTEFAQDFLDASKAAGFNRPSIKLRKDLSIKNVALVADPAVIGIPEIAFSADLAEMSATDTQPTADVQLDDYTTFQSSLTSPVARLLHGIKSLLEKFEPDSTDAFMPVPDEPVFSQPTGTSAAQQLITAPEPTFSQTTTPIMTTEQPQAPSVSQAFPLPTFPAAQAAAQTAVPSAPEATFSADDMQRVLREQEQRFQQERALQDARIAALERAARHREVELTFSSDDLRERITPALKSVAERLLLNDYNEQGEATFSADGQQHQTSRDTDVLQLLKLLPRINTRETALNGTARTFSADQDKQLDQFAKQMGA